MSGLAFSIDVSAMKRLAADLTRAQRLLPQAIARGLNAGGDKTRTQVQRALKEQTNVKAYKSITSRIRTVRAFDGRLQYLIIASGKGIPIKEFPVAVTPKGVDAKTWGVDHLFKRSFKQKFLGGLRARLGPEREKIRHLYGPALPKELGKGQSIAAFETSAAKFVVAEVEKSVGRLLASS